MLLTREDLVKRVVVTGLGTVSPLGNDVASTWQGVVAGRSGIGGITTSEDALEFIIAGATAIQVGTANFVDPGVYEKIQSMP